MRASESRRSTQTDAPRQRRSWRHFVRVLVLMTAALAMGLGAGCSSDNSSGCAGVMIEGQCQKRCQDSACAPGTRCVVFGTLNNACESPCKTQSDCPVGKDCQKYGFPDGTVANYCVRLDYSKGGRTGQHEACQSSDECDGPRGFTCIGQMCEQACTANGDCPGGYVCGTEMKKDDKTGKDTRFCVQDGTGKEGEACQDSTDCNQRSGLECLGGKCQRRCSWSGECPGGYCAAAGKDDSGNPASACVKDTFPRDKGQYGTACPNGSSDCDDANDFRCLGAGPGDLKAYCTKPDCTADADCPTGYFCSLQRTGTVPCQDACGFQGDSTQPDCAKAADIGAGKKYQCGPLSLLRHYCLKREFCNECKTDADCNEEQGQICAKDQSGNKICTVLCDPKTNSCPWGSAAKCGVWDKDLGKPTCAHRYGSCKSSGTPAGCDPCVDDSDCGSNGLCVSSQFTGEHFCLELGETCSCPAGTTQTCDGGGCPKAAGGKSSLVETCLGGSLIKQQGSPLYNTCYGANSSSDPFGTPQTGCWPPN